MEQLSFLWKFERAQPKLVNVYELLSPMWNGVMPTVTLVKKAIEEGREFHRFALIGRLDSSKISILGASSLAAETLKPTGDWKMIPLGYGFFMLQLVSSDDLVQIWSQNWKLCNQWVHFICWSLEFYRNKQKRANALL